MTRRKIGLYASMAVGVVLMVGGYPAGLCLMELQGKSFEMETSLVSYAVGVFIGYVLANDLKRGT